MSSTNIIKYDKFQISGLSITELSICYTKNFYVNYDTGIFCTNTNIKLILEVFLEKMIFILMMKVDI